jgi:hypothetical protein
MERWYLDESGDMGINGSKYFIITIISVHQENKLKHLNKLLNRGKYKKNLEKIRRNKRKIS